MCEVGRVGKGVAGVVSRPTDLKPTRPHRRLTLTNGRAPLIFERAFPACRCQYTSRRRAAGIDP